MANPTQRQPAGEANEPEGRRSTANRDERATLDPEERQRRERLEEIQRRGERARELRAKNRARSRRR